MNKYDMLDKLRNIRSQISDIEESCQFDELEMRTADQEWLADVNLELSKMINEYR